MTHSVIERSATVRRRAGGRRSRGRTAYLPYLIPGILLVVAVIIVPFLMNVGISFTHWSGAGPMEWTGLDNYKELFSDESFWASFAHNAVLIVAMAILPTVAGLVLSFALFDFIGKRFGTRAATVLKACIYLPQVLPAAVAGVVWAWILSPNDGALNAFLDKLGIGSLAQNWLGDPNLALYSVAGVLVWIQIGYPVIIFMAGMQRADPSLYEAAKIDGASWWHQLWHVTVPQIRPEIFVVLTTCTIASLKTFDKIYVLTQGGPGGATTVPAYSSWKNFFEKAQVGYGAAIATVLTILILVLTTVLLRAQGRGEEER